MASSLVAANFGSEFYHGGLQGRNVGDYLLPPKQTGQDPRGVADRWAGRSERVFVTKSKGKAQNYAAAVDGVVYRVLPEGDLHVDLIEMRAVMLLAESRHFRSIIKRDQTRLALLFHSAFSSFECDKAKVLGQLQ